MKKLIAYIAIICTCISISHANDLNTPFNTGDDVLEERIQNLDAKVDMKLTNLVKAKIIEFTTYKKGAERIIQRSKLYFPIFERQLKKYGVPSEFKYLPIIESNLKTTIRSRAGAVGLWQFMKGTGQAYGLEIGALVDERMDPEKSTEAAAKYLQHLYQQLNDWTLVLAAYNSGAGTVRKAIRKSGKRTYWGIYGYLPRETRSYLPKFIAAAYCANYYQHHDIEAQTIDQKLINTISAKIFEEIDFEEISEAAGTPIETLERLNPEFIKGFIPQSEGNYILTLPSRDMGNFLTSNVSAQIIVSSLPTAYRRSEVKVKSVNSRFINKLKIVARHIATTPTSLLVKQYKLYKLHKRETIAHVASSNGVTIEELLEINSLNGNSTGETLPSYIKVPSSIK